jgi:hypothetical protein
MCTASALGCVGMADPRHFRVPILRAAVSFDQRANTSSPEDLVGADRDPVAPLPNLRERQSMRHRWCPDFYVERRPGRDRFAPVLAFQQGGASGRGFEERFRRHVDRMPDAAVIHEADRAHLKRRR